MEGISLTVKWLEQDFLADQPRKAPDDRGIGVEGWS